MPFENHTLSPSNTNSCPSNIFFGCHELFSQGPRCSRHAKTSAPVALEDWFYKPPTTSLLDTERKVNKTLMGWWCQTEAQGPAQASLLLYCQRKGTFEAVGPAFLFSTNWHHLLFFVIHFLWLEIILNFLLVFILF